MDAFDVFVDWGGLWKPSTLGIAYNELGYYEYPAITSKIFAQKGRLLIDIND